MLCHLRRGIREATGQFRFSLMRGARADDVDGDAGRGDRQQRAGQEDAVRERREQGHRRGKSASTTRLSGVTVIDLLSRTVPSTHETSV